MSDTSFEIDEDDLTNENIPQGLRDAARAGIAARKQNEATTRELMFVRVGVDPKSADPKHAKLASMLFKTFDGDEAALRAEALDLGLIAAPAAPVNEALAGAAQQQAMRDQFSGGGVPAGGEVDPGPDPMNQALITYQKERRDGVQQVEAAHKAIASVLIAGAKGDERVMFNTQAHMQKAREIEGTNA